MPIPNREARDKVVGALRSLMAGQLSNAEFEDRLPANSSDPAIAALMSDNAWRLYGGAQRRDLPLGDRDRAIVARWQLFLKTDKPYEWPTPTRRERIALALAAVLTLGLSAKAVRKHFKEAGDLAVWPFLRRADYDAAMKSPAYL